MKEWDLRALHSQMWMTQNGWWLICGCAHAQITTHVTYNGAQLSELTPQDFKSGIQGCLKRLTKPCKEYLGVINIPSHQPAENCIIDFLLVDPCEPFDIIWIRMWLCRLKWLAVYLVDNSLCFDSCTIL